VSFESWLKKLESFPWWDSPTEWAATAYQGSWFIKQPDTDGCFLVDTKYDVYEVYPPLSYSVNDAWYEEEWWLEQGQPVQIEALGKWQFLYGLRELHLPIPHASVPQEIWPVLQGGWSTSVDRPRRKFWSRKTKTVKQDVDPEDFRGYLAQSIGVTDYDLYVFSCLLDSYNLAFAITPAQGRIETYEMSDFEVATASPQVAVGSHSPSSNLRNVGVGITSFSFGVSGTGGSNPVDDLWYKETIQAINRAISSPADLFEAISMATRWTSDPKWLKGFVREPLQNLQAYLTSQTAKDHFQVLHEAGYAVALIPLGGRTIWRP
jgi:hypothetical protein